MFFVGVEHGTRSIRATIIDNFINEKNLLQEESDTKGAVHFEVRRGGKKEPSFLSVLKQFAELEEIALLCMTYSMGDDFSEILPLKSLRNRGIKPPGGTGRMTGTGSRIFDELRDSGLPALAIPGMHRNSTFLHPQFRLLYSHCGAPDKICSTYASYRYLRSCLTPPYRKEDISFINADVGANTVSVLVVNGRVVGAVDACLGACGLSMGPLDLKHIRKVDRGELTASDAFEISGVFKGEIMRELNGMETGVLYSDDVIYKIIEKKERAKEKLEALALSVAMEIKGLTAFSSVDAVIITGAGARIKKPVNFPLQVERCLKRKVFSLNHYSASKGAALMAREIYTRYVKGEEDITLLGVPLNLLYLRNLIGDL